MFKKFVDTMLKKVAPMLAKFSENVVVKSIQRGFMATISVLIIGGFATLLASPPGTMEEATGIALGWHKIAEGFGGPLSAIKFATMDLVSLWTLFSITTVLSNKLKQDALSNLISAGTLFMIFTYVPFEGGIRIENFGSFGLFTAMIVSVLTVFLIKLLKDKNITLRFPESVPDMVARPFEALIPAFIIIVVGIVINMILGLFDLTVPSLIVTIFKPLVQFTGSLAGILLIAFLVHFLWSLGIHGGAVVMPIAMPFMLKNTTENMELIAQGLEPTNIFTVGFYAAYIMPLIGMALAMLIVAKSTHLKTVAKIGFVPMLFNITEPIGFGAPIVLNPPLAIARIIAVLVSTTLGYMTFAVGFVSMPSFQVPTFIPPFLGVFLSTTDWKAIVAWFVITAVVILIYIPFVKMYDIQLIKQEKEAA